MPDRQPGLTRLARGGACGGKVAPAVLREILGGMPAGIGAIIVFCAPLPACGGG